MPFIYKLQERKKEKERGKLRERIYVHYIIIFSLSGHLCRSQFSVGYSQRIEEPQSEKGETKEGAPEKKRKLTFPFRVRVLARR